MTETLPDTRPPETMHEAIEPDPGLARENMRLAWLLVGLFVVLFAGTFGVAFVYLWLS